MEVVHALGLSFTEVSNALIHTPQVQELQYNPVQ